MLELHIDEDDIWNEATEEFIHVPEIDLLLEHSLLSIAKWEGIHKKPLLEGLTEEGKLTPLEIMDYMRCMTITKNVPDNVYYGLSVESIEKFKKYLEDVPTATWFSDTGEEKDNKKPRTLTAELIYCWMINARIPKEYERWNVNRLMVLMRTISEENKVSNEPNKKPDMSKRRAMMDKARARYKNKAKKKP